MTTTEPATAAASVGRDGRRRRWAWLLLLGVAAVMTAAVLGAGFGRDPSVVDSVLLDGPAPPLAGPTLGGGRFDLAEHRGEVVLVNVWASWCVPCRREYPLLAEADRELSPLGLRIVGIDTQDTVADATAFLDGLGGENFPSVVDPSGRLAVEWGTFGVPETFVVDRDGQLVAKRVGELSPGWIVDHVVPLLGRP
ncbi:DsbE family thiol:disulfide interchange protein [soil metagenome]